MAPNIIRSISVAISIPLIDAAIVTDKKTPQYNNEIKQVKTKVNIEAKNADFLNTRINKKIKIIGMNARNVSILFNYQFSLHMTMTRPTINTTLISKFPFLICYKFHMNILS